MLIWSAVIMSISQYDDLVCVECCWDDLAGIVMVWSVAERMLLFWRCFITRKWSAVVK